MAATLQGFPFRTSKGVEEIAHCLMMLACYSRDRRLHPTTAVPYIGKMRDIVRQVAPVMDSERARCFSKVCHSTGRVTVGQTKYRSAHHAAFRIAVDFLSKLNNQCNTRDILELWSIVKSPASTEKEKADATFSLNHSTGLSDDLIVDSWPDLRTVIESLTSQLAGEMQEIKETICQERACLDSGEQTAPAGTTTGHAGAQQAQERRLFPRGLPTGVESQDVIDLIIKLDTDWIPGVTYKKIALDFLDGNQSKATRLLTRIRGMQNTGHTTLPKASERT
jgi:hypothetical protein